MSENVGYATLQVIPSMKGVGARLEGEVSREVDGAGDKAGKGFGKGFISGMVGGFAAGGLSILTSKILGFAGGAVDAFARVEDATGAAGVVFGKNVVDVSKWAQSAGTSFGLSKGAALDAALTFGTFGKAAGKTGQDLSGFATGMAGLAGDLASFRGTSTEQAVEAIGAALRGEMEPIRAYGVLLDDATLRDEALRMGLIKTTKDALTPQQKTLAAQSAILKQTKDAQGDYARTSSSTANTQKTLAAQTENAQAALGEKLAPALTWVRQRALDAITGFSGFIDVVVAVGARIGEAAGFVREHGTVFSIVGGIIAAVFLPHLIAVGVQALISGARSVAGWAMTQAGAVKAAVVHSGAVLRIVAGWVMMGVSALRSGAQTVAIWALYRIEALKGAAASAAASARVVGSWLLMSAQSMLAAGRMALSWTIGVVTGAATAVVSMAVSAASVVAGWVVMGVQSLLQAGRMALAWFIALGPIGWAIAAIIAVVAVVIANWDKVVAWTKAAWTAVSSWVTTAWEWVKSAVMGAVTFVVNLIKAYFNLYVTIIRTALNAALAVVRWVWTGIQTAVSFYVNLVKGVVQTGIKAVVAAIDWLKALPGKVGGFFQSMLDKVNSKVSSIVSTVKGLPGKITSALGNLGGLLLDKGEQIVNGLISGIRNMGSKLAGFVKKFIADHIPGPVAKALGIASPSRVMAALAKWIPLGLVKGIDATAPVLDRRMDSLVKAPTMPDLGPGGAGPGNGPGWGGDTYGDVVVQLAVKDLEELQTVQDFLDLIQRKRVDDRREASGKVVA